MFIDNQLKYYFEIQNTIRFHTVDNQNQTINGYGFAMVIERVLEPFWDVLVSVFYQIYTKMNMH